MSLSSDTRPQTPEHSDGGQAFFTSVGCMDGRVQRPIVDYGQKKFRAKHPDTITEAGLVGQLSKDHLDQYLVESLESKIKISLEKHHSKGIVVYGHENCAASDAVDEKKHKEDILKAAEFLGFLFPRITIVPVYVKKINDSWTVGEL